MHLQEQFGTYVLRSNSYNILSLPLFYALSIIISFPDNLYFWSHVLFSCAFSIISLFINLNLTRFLKSIALIFRQLLAEAWVVGLLRFLATVSLEFRSWCEFFVDFLKHSASKQNQRMYNNDTCVSFSSLYMNENFDLLIAYNYYMKLKHIYSQIMSMSYHGTFSSDQNMT